MADYKRIVELQQYVVVDTAGDPILDGEGNYQIELESLNGKTLVSPIIAMQSKVFGTTTSSTTPDHEIYFVDTANVGTLLGGNFTNTEGRVSLTVDASGLTAAHTTTTDLTALLLLKQDKITSSNAAAIRTLLNVADGADVTPSWIPVSDPAYLTSEENDVEATDSAYVDAIKATADSALQPGDISAITPATIAAIAANTAKVSITTTEQQAIVANTAKESITTQQKADITANNTKEGITPQQKADITTNNAKEGITTTQKGAITDNATHITEILNSVPVKLPTGITTDTHKDYVIRITDVSGIETATYQEATDVAEENDLVAGDSTYVDGIKTTADSALQSFTEANNVVAGNSTYVDGIKTTADAALTGSALSTAISNIEVTNVLSNKNLLTSVDGVQTDTTDFSTLYAVGDGGLTENDFTDDRLALLGSSLQNINVTVDGDPLLTSGTTSIVVGNKTFTPPALTITNDLTATVAGTALDATQGKILKTAVDLNTTHRNADHAPTNAEVNVNADWDSTSGDSEILNKPTIPTVNDATISFKINGTTILGNFTTNQSGNEEIDFGTISGMGGSTSPWLFYPVFVTSTGLLLVNINDFDNNEFYRGLRISSTNTYYIQKVSISGSTIAKTYSTDWDGATSTESTIKAYTYSATFPT